MTIFGTLAGQPDVEAAVIETLKTWLPTYLWEVERQAGLRKGTLQHPPTDASYFGGLDFDSWSEDECPSVIVVVNPTGEAEPSASAGYGQWFEVEVAAVVVAEDEHTARRYAGHYGVAIQSVLPQHGGLGGLATRTMLTSAAVIEFPDPDIRRLLRARATFQIFVEGFLSDRTGPKVPAPPDSPQYPGTPDQPWHDYPVVTSTAVTSVAEPSE